MQRMSQHFDAWVTCTGNILVMNHTISSMGAFPWGGRGDRFAVLERCATQDNPNGCITNSTQDIRYRKEQQF